MTQQRIKELWPVMEAFKNGKKIESRFVNVQSPWIQTHTPTWDEALEYRIAPEPREFWVNEYKDGTLSIHYEEPWADQYDPQFRIRCFKVVEVLGSETK
jgi:hypothetical protein